MPSETKEIDGRTWHLSRGFRQKSKAKALAKKKRNAKYAPVYARVVKSGRGWAVYVR